MDTTRPPLCERPLMCERCREPIGPTDRFRVLTARDEEAETGKPAVISGKVVHEKCWAAWVEADGIK